MKNGLYVFAFGAALWLVFGQGYFVGNESSVELLKSVGYQNIQETDRKVQIWKKWPSCNSTSEVRFDFTAYNKNIAAMQQVYTCAPYFFGTVQFAPVPTE